MDRRAVALVAVALAAAVAVPFVAGQSEYVLDVLFLIFLYGAMATAWNLLGGFAGQVSFGHAAFLGIGAYTTAILTQIGVSLWLAVPAASLLAGLYSLVIGIPAFRLRGPYFSIATIGIGEATRLVALNWTSLTGGASGLTLSAAPPLTLQYFAALALCALTVALAAWIKRSRFGFALAAVRQDPDAAETLGVATTLVKTQALFLSACIIGVAGSVYALHYLFISPDSVFGFSTSIGLVIMPIVGGLGTVTGPLIGAVVYTFIREQLAATLANADLLAFGLLLIAIVVFEPRGILGIVDRVRRAARAKAAPAVQR
ncbi:branched-chain amino acid ABC transporter permease [Vulcanimicrobium alpinum]|uniref:Branched-chain amino acid ABC transporter permease n=1 Tax=Vulcanimicrobium alpinum TaxID=3016050 RepID=A0AAN1XT61_UNVUL|nr:branched-chain amino acid ABC transporter permease [Vulcanimicrobium alpinum]BDE04794.1 branched-chain amino acid ABC transporter permease [Vulcanimicrobium alpinum]